MNAAVMGSCDMQPRGDGVPIKRLRADRGLPNESTRHGQMKSRTSRSQLHVSTPC